jgi:hypothetical protein
LLGHIKFTSTFRCCKFLTTLKLKCRRVFGVSKRSGCHKRLRHSKNASCHFVKLQRVCSWHEDTATLQRQLTCLSNRFTTGIYCGMETSPNRIAVVNTIIGRTMIDLTVIFSENYLSICKNPRFETNDLSKKTLTKMASFLASLEDFVARWSTARNFLKRH